MTTEDLLRMLGVGAHEAHDICRRPLPDLDDPTQRHPRLLQRAEPAPGPPDRPTPVTKRQTKSHPPDPAAAGCSPSPEKPEPVNEVMPPACLETYAVERPASARAAWLFSTSAGGMSTQPW
jgi:hypothetical protein